MLNSLAHRLDTSAQLRHLLFLAATFFTIAFIGYHFGTFDQAIHIPFLIKYADPTLFPNDRFFDLRFQHYSYFWFLFQPFYRLGLLEPAMFVAHVLATYLAFWAVWTLSRTLFRDSLAALLGVVAFSFPHVGFAGFPAFEFSLLNRTFVFPFLLWAIVLFLRGRYLPAFLLLGVMYNLHVISAQFVLAMFLFDGLLEFRQIGWRNLLLGLVVFVIAALPVLLWKLSGSAVDFTPRPEWFSIIARGSLYNLFVLIAPYPHILLATLSGLSTFALLAIARRRAPSPGHDQTVTHFMVAVAIILLVQVITAEWWPITIVVQSQIIRAGIFALVFGYLYFANYLAQRFQAGDTDRRDDGLLAVALVLTTIPLIPLIVWAWQRLARPAPWRTLATAVGLTAMFAVNVALAVHYQVWYPGIYIYAHRTPWYDVQIWAHDHTPKETLFITPPEIWWFFESDWRVSSERSTVVTLSELLEAAFAPEYMDVWVPRFNALAPGALARFRGDFFENRGITARAFYGLSTQAMLGLASQYGADYLIVEKPNLRQLPVAYENAQFVVYDLRPVGGHE